MSDVELFDKWQETIRELDRYKDIINFASVLIEELQKQESSLFGELMARGLVS